MSRRTQKVEIYLAKEISGLAFFSWDLRHIFGSSVGNEFGVMLRGKGTHKIEFAHDIVRIHSLMIYTDLIEYKIVGDTKAPMLRCFPFFLKLKAGDIITTGQYMNYQTISNLQFRPLLKNSFHSIHIDLRDTTGEKTQFVSVGITRLSLMFRKASNIHFLSKRRYKMVASRQKEIPFYSVGRQRGRGFGALAQIIGRTAIQILPKHIVPAAKRVGADLLEFAVPEIAELVSGGKCIKTAARNGGRQTLRKQLGSGGRKPSVVRVIPTKSEKINQSVVKRHFHKNFSLIMSSSFRYQPFVAVSGNLGWKVPVVDYVLSSDEQEIYPTTSLDENCIEFEFQTDQIYYVDLRQTYLALKLKLVRGRGYETYNTKEEAKVEEEETAEEAPVLVITHVNILISIFSNFEVYINNQHFFNSNGLYTHKSYICNNFKGAISDYKGVLHCEVYDYEELPDEIMQALLSENFFTRRMKMLSRPDGFMLFGKFWVDIFSTSELLYPNMKIRLRLIRAGPKFNMISDNPNVSLGIVDCSLYTRLIAQR